MWDSNVLSQILLSIGYAPTIHNLIKQKRNTESLIGWSCSIIAASIALYPAIVGGNTLAIIYVSRALFFSFLLIGFMIYYEIRSSIAKYKKH